MYSDYDKIVSIVENKENADIVSDLMNNRGVKYIGSPITMTSFVMTEYKAEDEINCKNYKATKYLLEHPHTDLAAISNPGAIATHYIGYVFVFLS